jgi:uncharacterized protein (DUF4415 family)
MPITYAGCKGRVSRTLRIANCGDGDGVQGAGQLEPHPKTPVSMRLDEDIVKWFRARGKGYQTRINAALRAYVESR